MTNRPLPEDEDGVLSHPAKWQDAHPPEKPYVAVVPKGDAPAIGEPARSPEAPPLGSDGLEVDQSITPDYKDVTEVEAEGRVGKDTPAPLQMVGDTVPTDAELNPRAVNKEVTTKPAVVKPTTKPVVKPAKK